MPFSVPTGVSVAERHAVPRAPLTALPAPLPAVGARGVRVEGAGPRGQPARPARARLLAAPQLPAEHTQPLQLARRLVG